MATVIMVAALELLVIFSYFKHDKKFSAGASKVII